MQNENKAVSIKKRSEINNSFKWDLTKIYENNDLWYQDYKLLEKLLTEFPKYKGIVLKNSNNLLNVISLYIDLKKRLSKLYVYAYMKSDEDTTNSLYQGLKGKIDNLNQKVAVITSFLIPELLKGNSDEIIRFIETEPKLKEYKRYLLDVYRFKPYVLKETEEKLLSNMINVLNNPDKTANLLRNADLQFKDIIIDSKKYPLNDSNYIKYMESFNIKIRKLAFLNLYDGYKSVINTFSSTLAGEVEANLTIAKIRGYKSAREMSLFSNYINIEVYDNLLKVVNDNLAVIYKYYKLRKEHLKLNQLTMFDMYVPLIKLEKQYSFKEGMNIIIKALSILGEDYLKNIKRAFNENWIDIYPSKGKRSGAYSWGAYKAPSYILLNYQNGLSDVATLAHELGHSMHSTYSKNNNNYQDFQYKIFVAEVASITNELILYDYLLKNSLEKSEKLLIINYLLDLFKNTLFRQAMFAQFEKQIYESEEVLTKDYLCKIYYDLNKLYFGSDVLVNEEIKYEWARIPHFYTPFYVYQYATGIAAATYFAKGIINGDEELLKRYLHFLTTGGSDEPLNLLKNAGIDMLDVNVIQNAIDWFSELIDEFIKLSRE